MLPPWVQDGGPGPLPERLADRAASRASCAPRSPTRRGVRHTRRPWAGPTFGWVRSSRPENMRWESRTLADVMDEHGVDVVDAICDLLLSRGPERQPGHERAVDRRACTVLPTRSAWSARTRRSSADKPSPRTYGSYPRVLGEFVREQALLTLEEAVRKMTSAPAARLGLTDRGRLADGLEADRGRSSIRPRSRRTRHLRRAAAASRSGSPT